MRRIAGFVTCVALLGACGGTDFQSSAPGSTASQKATTTTLEPVSAAERAEYLEAAERGVLDDPRRPPGITVAQGRCIARALVNGIGVRRMRDAGIDPAELRRPGYDFPSRFSASIPARSSATSGHASKAVILADCCRSPWQRRSGRARTRPRRRRCSASVPRSRRRNIGNFSRMRAWRPRPALRPRLRWHGCCWTASASDGSWRTRPRRATSFSPPVKQGA